MQLSAGQVLHAARRRPDQVHHGPVRPLGPIAAAALWRLRGAAPLDGDHSEHARPRLVCEYLARFFYYESYKGLVVK